MTVEGVHTVFTESAFAASMLQARSVVATLPVFVTFISEQAPVVSGRNWLASASEAGARTRMGAGLTAILKVFVTGGGFGASTLSVSVSVTVYGSSRPAPAAYRRPCPSTC